MPHRHLEHEPWDPHLATEGRDPRDVYDEARGRCPVAPRAGGGWTVFGHAAAVEVASRSDLYSNAVSRFLQVPNGLDGPRHAAVRRAIDPLFEAARMRDLEPRIARVASALVAEIALPARVDAVALGARFAVRAQCAWLGWPADLEEELLAWMADNHAATRSRDTRRTAAVAERFDAIITRLTAERRAAGTDAPDDVTTELLRVRVEGEPLTDPEVTSILRNFTGGDLGSMALCAGVILTYIADHPPLQARLRSGVSDAEGDAILDEILRIDDPFLANRRRASVDTSLAGHEIAAGDVVIVNWTAANRDPAAFGDPDAFAPKANRDANLVYGIGPHVCPGRPLATLELRVLVREVLARTSEIAVDSERTRVRSMPPLGGFEEAPLVLR